MEELFLPVLSHFQNGNSWTGSGGALRYRMTPREACIFAEIWEGPWCYEYSRVEESREFPMDEQGIADMGAWISGWAEEMKTRPPKSFVETVQRRDAVEAERAAEQQEPSETL